MLKKYLLIILLGILSTGFLNLAEVQAVDHPRILLDTTLISQMRTKVKNNDPSWVSLKALCDKYLSGSVEYPDGNDYPNGGSIGEGYQGEGYFDPLISLGVCYHALKDSDPSQAAKYAAKGVEVLQKMSVPSGKAHYQDPLRDNGYGIRFFGVGMALGYDWFADKMSSADKAQVYTSLNHWITKYEQDGFGYEHPQGNYFAGYYAAEALAALATEGENPQATDLWNSWVKKHQELVQPYYETWLKGGGWPEGWNYGALGTVNMVWPTIAAKTAKNINLISDANHRFSFPNDQALNLIHFSWPTYATLDDRGKIYRGDNPAQTNVDTYIFLIGVLEKLGATNAQVLRDFTQSIPQAENKVVPWEKFLFWSNDNSSSKVSQLPFSYVAAGMNQVAMRSSWNTDAIWASFVSGPYTNYPGSGEQFFDQGSLVIVKGRTPFLVNATGALLRNKTVGVDDKEFEDAIYNDNFGSRARSLYNIFYAGKGQVANSPDLKSVSSVPSARLTNFEDAGGYVAFQGRHLESMYPANTISAWDRQVVYLRPDIFVVFDKTIIPNASIDHYQAFHLTYTPSEVTAPLNAGYRYVVKQNNGYVGSVTTLYPKDNKTKLVNVFDSNKVYRLEVRPGSAAKEEQWLTVFDTAASLEATESSRLNTEKGIEGALIKKEKNNYAVLFAENLVSSVSYTIPAKNTIHVISNLSPGKYNVELQEKGSELVVVVKPGSVFEASSEGRLYFMNQGKNVIPGPADNRLVDFVPPPQVPPITTPLPHEGSTWPVFHVYSATVGDFYTVSEVEKNKLLASGVWRDKGVAYRVPEGCPTDAENGLVRVRRFDNRSRLRYLYTAGLREQTRLQQVDMARTWKDKGDVFCAYSSSGYAENSLPVYRLRNTQTSRYFYTISEIEYKQLLASRRWVFEGISYYAFTP